MAEQDINFGGVLSEALGQDTVSVIDVIGSPLEDKEISAKLDFETSKVRTILNDLLVKNLVALDRDRQDTGYCYYRWSRREDKILEYLNSYVETKIRELDGMLSSDDEIVFECGCALNQVSSGKGSRRIKGELKRFQELKNAS
jgi:transcription initiation factor IIE alpha subunit